MEPSDESATGFRKVRATGINDENSTGVEGNPQLATSVRKLQEAARGVEADEEGEALFDWSAICRTLEETYGDATDDGTRTGGSCGVTITSSTEKGHLQYTCSDGCFARVTLADVKGVTFPGAYGRQPVSDLWTAWKMASIFIRNDITVAQKIQYQMEQAVILDAGALCSVLRLAYEVCTDWTVFLCTSKGVATHAPIDGNCITDFYRVAFEQFKKDLKEESRAARKTKQGPVGFAGPETALLLERDGPRGGIITKVVITYTGLKETLENWKTFAIWVIVWPLENRGQEDVMKEIVDLARSHLDDGGRIVTAWPPVTAPKEAKWKSMRKIWKTLDDVIAGYGAEDQVVLTASNFVSDNKIFLEAGTPEAAAQFYGCYPGVAAAKTLYSVICRRARKLQLPELERSSMRTSTGGRGGGVSGADGGRPPLKRRAV